MDPTYSVVFLLHLPLQGYIACLLPAQFLWATTVTHTLQINSTYMCRRLLPLVMGNNSGLCIAPVWTESSISCMLSCPAESLHKPV